jgi:hypothetical protein
MPARKMMTSRTKSTRKNAAPRPAPNPAQEKPAPPTGKLTFITTGCLIVMLDHHPVNVWDGQLRGQFINTIPSKQALIQAIPAVANQPGEDLQSSEIAHEDR